MDNRSESDLDTRSSKIAVEVIYAQPGKSFEYQVSLASGCTVDDAIRSSGILTDVSGISLEAGVGIFGVICKTSQVLADGDRVEIYRPLELDPREARRLRAAGQLS